MEWPTRAIAGDVRKNCPVVALSGARPGAAIRVGGRLPGRPPPRWGRVRGRPTGVRDTAGEPAHDHMHVNLHGLKA